MIRLDTIRRIYFIGIGGIGMSALARYFASQGKQVSGYDRTETALTHQLQAEGIGVVYDDSADLAPKNTDLVVYTPAIPADHPQLRFFHEHSYPLVKRSEVLGAITEHSFNICVAGTHGKTTISTMIAHILRNTGYGCNAFLGGIAANYNTNFWSSENNTCVIEADEYDRSFLRLSPDIAVITAMDADHLDIYGTESAVQDAFVDFSRRVKADGTLFVKKGLARDADFSNVHIVRYKSDDRSADVYAHNISMANGHYLFDLVAQHQQLTRVALNMGGLHNVENASVAMAVALQLGINAQAVREAVGSFRGVRRRFEYLVRESGLVCIDDYAHHPEELAALIGSARKLFSDLSCTVVFQPHLFTRTRDLADGFAKSLSLADSVILLPIYPARELPIEGVSSYMIAEKLSGKASVMSPEEVLAFANTFRKGLLILAGAGDIDQLAGPIKQIFLKAHS